MCVHAMYCLMSYKYMYYVYTLCTYYLTSRILKEELFLPTTGCFLSSHIPSQCMKVAEDAMNVTDRLCDVL